MKTLCSKCRWGNTLNLQDQMETWCANDHFKLRIGHKNWPEISECEDYDIIANRGSYCKTPDWWNDLYTDATGQCFSDADTGL